MGARPSEDLEHLLGHRFARPELLEEALTHPSAPQRSYERMEFLGDRVLGLAVAELLFHRFPQESEGKIARRHAKLASREALAAVACALDLQSFLRIAGGTRASDTILADCCEAVLGALYLDGGWEPARRFVAQAWENLIAADLAPPSDAKTALQEWAQGRGLPLPAYREVGRTGPAHAPEFVVEVSLAGRAPSRGAGRSKREAERAAAEAMLAGLPGPERQAG